MYLHTSLEICHAVGTTGGIGSRDTPLQRHEIIEGKGASVRRVDAGGADENIGEAIQMLQLGVATNSDDRATTF